MMPDVFAWRSVTIGTVTMEVNEDGSVTFTDTSSTKPPITLYRMGKARGIVSQLLRAVKRLPPTSGISWVDERHTDDDNV